MSFNKITEATSHYESLEKMTIRELLTNINNEDQTVPLAVAQSISQIEVVIEKVVSQLKNKGRLFYIGAGTSGRLGILDASECPPTYGVSSDLVIGLIAGGDHAIRNAVENAEDNAKQAAVDLENFNINANDFVIGIAASGTTPYVIGGIQFCKLNKIPTACITCNPESPLALSVDFPIEVIVGPEFVTGSSRMKAGTAQKLVLNMISTATMIQLGKVKGNKMTHMKLSNHKLVYRAQQMIVDELKIELDEAKKLLEIYGNVANVLKNYNKNGSTRI
nr:N-acetylmuramic acid 6-phosphate etherase [uncultured Flavobacterium sp.]